MVKAIWYSEQFVNAKGYQQATDVPQLHCDCFTLYFYGLKFGGSLTGKRREVIFSVIIQMLDYTSSSTLPICK